MIQKCFVTSNVVRQSCWAAGGIVVVVDKLVRYQTSQSQSRRTDKRVKAGHARVTRYSSSRKEQPMLGALNIKGNFKWT